MKRTGFKSKPVSAYKCANKCGKQAAFVAGTSKVCSIDCAKDLGIARHKKKQDDEHKARKKVYMEDKRPTRLRATKEVCHLYIRLRDANEDCICCGRSLGEDFQAGHFMESGNYTAVRYDEDNIHGQRKDCNMHKGGDSGEYEIRLRRKIGDAAVDRIHRIKSTVTRHTVDELREIEAYYKRKIEELKASNE